MGRSATNKIFFKGLAALLPTAVTIIIFVKLYELLESTIGKWLTYLVAYCMSLVMRRPYKDLQASVPSVIGVLLAIVLIYFTGLLLALFIGRKIWGSVEGRLRRVPIINAIYPAVKQVTDFFLEDSGPAFRKVVLLEYPRKGIYSIGFVTSRAFITTEALVGEDMVTVFVPSSPTPFTGYCVQAKRSEVLELDMSVEVALKYIVSGGVVLPVSEGGTLEEIPVAAIANVQAEADAQDEDPHREE